MERRGKKQHEFLEGSASSRLLIECQVLLWHVDEGSHMGNGQKDFRPSQINLSFVEKKIRMQCIDFYLRLYLIDLKIAL